MGFLSRIFKSNSTGNKETELDGAIKTYAEFLKIRSLIFSAQIIGGYKPEYSEEELKLFLQNYDNVKKTHYQYMLEREISFEAEAMMGYVIDRFLNVGSKSDKDYIWNRFMTIFVFETAKDFIPGYEGTHLEIMNNLTERANSRSREYFNNLAQIDTPPKKLREICSLLALNIRKVQFEYLRKYGSKDEIDNFTVNDNLTPGLITALSMKYQMEAIEEFVTLFRTGV